MTPEQFIMLETDEELLAAVTCGFELETQSFDGVTRNMTHDLCQNDKAERVDHREWLHEVDQLMSQAQQDPVWLLACLDDPERNQCDALEFAIYRLAGSMGCHKWTATEKEIPFLARQWAKDMHAAGHGVSFSQLKVMDYYHNSILQLWVKWFNKNSLDLSKFVQPYPYKSTQELLDLPEELDAVDDLSVAGPELITIGGLSADKFLELADYCFRRNPVIDERCSFHVNLSLNYPLKEGKLSEMISHDPKFMLAAQEYLLMMRSEWPACVKARAANKEWMDQYAALGGDYDKYRLVANRRTRYEFRLWGNVKTIEDARKCLLISVRALHHAYRVRLGLEPLLVRDAKDLQKQWRKAV